MAGYTPSGLGGNQPSTVTAATSYNFLGALTLSNFAAMQPDVNPELTKRYGYQDDILSLLEKLGMVKRTSNSSIFRHWEEDRLHAPVALTSTSAGAANANHEVNIAAGGVFEIGQTAPYIGSGKTDVVMPAVFDVGYFSNGVECVVTDVDPDTPSFTVCPTQNGENVPAVAPGDFFYITSSIAPEGSGRQAAKNGRLIYYENNMGIIRSDNEITGTARGELMWTEFNGKYGSGLHWYYKSMDDFWKRHKQKIAHANIFGQNITNTVLTGLTGLSTLKKTKGLVPTIRESGIVEEYTIGNMELSDIRSLIDSLTEQQACNDYVLLNSIGLRDDFNRLFREGDGVDFKQADRASIIFANFNGGVQSVDFDVDVAKYLGYNFHLKTQRAFSDPTQLGGINQYQEFAIGIPMGEVNIYEELGGRYVKTPAAAVVYKGDGMGGDRSWVETGRGLQETGTDSLEHTIITECGIETYAINHSFTLEGSAS